MAHGWLPYGLLLVAVSVVPLLYVPLRLRSGATASPTARVAQLEVTVHELRGQVQDLQRRLSVLEAGPSSALRLTYQVPREEWDRRLPAALERHPFLRRLHLEPYWDLQGNPYALQALEAVPWTPQGMRVTPVPQQEPKWKGNSLDKPRYFEGYVFPAPHRCPGSPFECGGRGVCQRDASGNLTGRCLCRPPATGWDCSLVMRNAPERIAAHDGRQQRGWCADQPIKDRRTAKWNERAQACEKKNGMWLGLNATVTRYAALSFAAALGLREGDSLFSVGSGCGTLLKEVRDEWGPSVAVGGVDFSVGGVEHSRRILPDGQFCVADIRHMEVVPSASYDFVWTHGVIWYILQREVCGVVLDMVRIAKPGGAVLIADMMDPQHQVPCQMGKSDGGGSHYRIDKLEKCIAHLGLKVDYVGMKDVTGGVYDTYCSAELYVALLRKV